jgi:nitroreductase
MYLMRYLLFKRRWYRVSDKLAAWDVQETDFPSTGTLFDQLEFLLRYAVLAPSGPNTQPWRLSIKDNEVSLIADFARSLPSLDPTNRTLYLSHGCLLANTLIAAEHFGFGYDLKCLPDGLSGERTVAIQFSENGNEHRFPDLFQEITKRHTNRKPYENRAIEPEKIQMLKDCINREGFRLDIISDIEGKSNIADILARSQKIQLGNKDMRKELAKWIRPNTSDLKDGLPGYSFGYSDFESYLGSFIFGTFDMSSSRARIETASMKTSPAVSILSTDGDDKSTWIKAGMLFETMFLTATKLNVRFDLFSQPIAIPELRQELAQILNTKYPQLLIRMGYAQPQKHTPRRPIEEVLMA